MEKPGHIIQSSGTEVWAIRLFHARYMKRRATHISQVGTTLCARLVLREWSKSSPQWRRLQEFTFEVEMQKSVLP